MNTISKLQQHSKKRHLGEIVIRKPYKKRKNKSCKKQAIDFSKVSVFAAKIPDPPPKVKITQEPTKPIEPKIDFDRIRLFASEPNTKKPIQRPKAIYDNFKSHYGIYEELQQYWLRKSG